MILLIWSVPLLYGLVYALEFSAILSRQAGIITQKNITAYAIQQAVYMGTRFALLFLLPLLGYVVDSGVPPTRFIMIIHLSFLAATLSGAFVYLNRRTIVAYYIGVITDYDSKVSFLTALTSNLRKEKALAATEVLTQQTRIDVPAVRRLFLQSLAVFTVYAIGIFIAFYGATAFFEYRTMISQLSGIINAVGAVLLTFVVEPTISRNIDAKDPHAIDMVTALFLGRLAAVAITAHIFMLFVYVIIG